MTSDVRPSGPQLASAPMWLAPTRPCGAAEGDGSAPHAAACRAPDPAELGLGDSDITGRRGRFDSVQWTALLFALLVLGCGAGRAAMPRETLARAVVPEVDAISLDFDGARALVLARSGELVLVEVASGTVDHIASLQGTSERGAVVLLRNHAFVSWVHGDGAFDTMRLDLGDGALAHVGIGEPPPAVAPDGSAAVSYVDYQTLRFERTDGETYECSPEGSVEALVVATGGRLFAEIDRPGVGSSRHVTVLDPRDCSALASFDTSAAEVASIGLTADGSTLVLRQSDGVHVIDTASGAERFALRGDGMIARDGETLLVWDGSPGPRVIVGSLALADGRELEWTPSAREEAAPAHVVVDDAQHTLTVFRGATALGSVAIAANHGRPGR